MAVEKILNTRLQMKYDSYNNWTSSTLGEGKGANFVLRAGEIGICYLPANYSENQVTGSAPPQILMKVGDGTSTFAQLPWVSAKSADVYAWAKQANLPVAKVGAGNVVSSIEWDETTHGLKFVTASVATSEGFEQLTNRVQTIENTYATDAELSAAVEAINAAIALKADKTYVDEQLGLKVNVSDFNTFKTENTAAIGTAKSEAIAAAKSETETQVGALREGAVKANADAIAAINNGITGILAQAKAYADQAEADAVATAAADAAAKVKALADDAVAKNTAAITGIKNGATVNDFAAVESGFATTVAAIKKVQDDAAEALNTYKTANDAAVALKASNADLEIEIARAKAAEKANADAIELLTNGVDQEKVDGVKDLIDYVEKHGPEVVKMKEDIAANTKAISDESARADAEEKRLAGLIADNADDIAENARAIAALNAADGKVANATMADKANSLTDAAKEEVKAVKVNNAANADHAGDADKLGGVAAADYATKAYADQAEADAIASANANTAEVIKNYYTKGEADAAFMDATETGNAINAKITALNLGTTYEPIGAESRAKAYADGLASNYATAAQGAKADSALQNVEVGTGLKVSTKANNKQTIEFDDSVVFVFNCGSSTTVI